MILVEPKYEGNIGAVARAMANFDAKNLVLVNPPALGEEARKRAMHGAVVLDAAVRVEDLDSALRDVDFIAGTSGITTASEKRFARISITARDLAARVRGIDGTVGLLFGREDFGLLEEELHRCDFLVTIPAAKEYPILNIAHAATIVLYEIYTARVSPHRGRKASGFEKEKLYDAFANFLTATEYPAHKRARTRILFRRLMGRAAPSTWEFHALMGVFQRGTKRILRPEGKR